MYKYLKTFVFTFLLFGLFSCDKNTTLEFGESQTFIKFFGGIGEDIGQGVVQTLDGGYAIVGTSSSFTQNNNNTNIYVVKTDELGNEQWQKNFGDSIGNDTGEFIQLTDDGGLIIAGSTSFSSDVTAPSDILLIKLDSAGQIQWQQVYGEDTIDEKAKEVRNTSDGGFIVIGEAFDPNNSSQLSEMMLLKVNAQGIIDWLQPQYHGFRDKNDLGVSIVEALNGGYMELGTIEDPSQNTSQMRVVRSNSLGNETGDILFENTASQAAQIQLSSPGYVIVGTEGVGNNQNISLIKISENREVIWNKVLDESGSQTAFSITTLIGGGYALTGASINSGEETADIQLMLINDQGDLKSTNTFGGLGNDVGHHIIQTSDGGFLMTGTVEFENNKLMTLIKTDSNGFVSEK